MDETWQEFLRELEQVRAVVPTIGVEMRASDDDAFIGTLSGHFSVFNRWYEINSIFEGRFLERTASGAFARTIGAHRDSNDGRIQVLFNHGMDPSVGDKILGPILDMREDQTGPFYEVGLQDTSFNRDLEPGLRSGLYGSSFRFRVTKDEWDDDPGRSDHNPDGIPERTIREVRVFEFGPVTFPANPDATAGVRSMTDDFYNRMRARNPDRYDQLLARAREIRTPSSEGPANSTEDSSRLGHSEGLTRARRQQVLRRKHLTDKGLIAPGRH